MSSSLNIETGPSNDRYDIRMRGEAAPDSRVRLKNRVFAIAVTLVAITSIYDAFLVYHFRQSIDEQNPFCAWLISLEPEYVSVFLLSKGLGTLFVVSILIGLFKYWRPVAIPVALFLVLFQAGLMSYVHGTDGRRQLDPQFAMATVQYQPSRSNPSSNASRAKKNARGTGAAQKQRRRDKGIGVGKNSHKSLDRHLQRNQIR